MPSSRRNCAILSAVRLGNASNRGHRRRFVPEVLDLHYIDGIVQTTRRVHCVAKRLAGRRHFFCGIFLRLQCRGLPQSSAAFPDIGLIVTMINDNGHRYFTTELCGAPAEVEIPDREHNLSEADQTKIAQKELIILK